MPLFFRHLSVTKQTQVKV